MDFPYPLDHPFVGVNLPSPWCTLAMLPCPRDGKFHWFEWGRVEQDFLPPCTMLFIGFRDFIILKWPSIMEFALPVARSIMLPCSRGGIFHWVG